MNDLPEVVHSHTGQVQGCLGKSQALYNLHCAQCGGLCCYVDDSTYSFSSSDPVELSEKLSEQYSRIADYMGDNRLVINDDKTHLLVMGGQKFHAIRPLVNISTGTVTVKPVETEKLLGLNIHQSLKWKEHVISNKKSMIKTLTTRLNALRKLAVNANFKTRLMVANSCFMSIIIYMVSVWGGTAPSHLPH